MGVIRTTEKAITNVLYKVDDMTGAPIEVKQWMDTEVGGVLPVELQNVQGRQKFISDDRTEDRTVSISKTFI